MTDTHLTHTYAHVRYSAYTYIVCLFILITIITACSPFSSGKPQAQIQRNTVPVKVTVDERPGAAINANLVGLSVEMSQVCSLVQLAQQDPTYLQYYKNLGSSILRIGGNSADTSVWSPHGKATCATDSSSKQQTVVTPQLVTQLFDFARQVHWKVIWGLNLAANDPAQTTDEAVNVARIGKENLLGFTVGNEPELYTQRGLRPPDWNEQHFQEEWNQYIDSIRRRVNTTFVGPEACCTTPLFKSFLQNDTDGDIGISSHHLYAITNMVTGSATPSIPLLLSASTLQNEQKLLNQWTQDATTAHTTLALTEVNSVSGGGINGISNTLAAALWADDLLFQAAQRPTITTVDFHNTAGASYNALTADGEATPLYYGLLFFHYATAQARWLNSTLHASESKQPNVSAYALIHPDHSMSLFLINKELSQNVSLQLAFTHQDPRYAQQYTNVTTVALTGAEVGAQSGIQLGARALSSRATWSPTESVPHQWHAQDSITIGAGSAMLIMLS